jgi:hypothetical protein
MDGPNQINAARGSPDTIPRRPKANQNRGPEPNQLPHPRPAELRRYTPSLRERIAWGIKDGLMALGLKAYAAGHLGRGLADIMSLTPLGIPLAANDAGRAMQRRDWGGVLVSSIGMLPAAKTAERRRAARCYECPQSWSAADRTNCGSWGSGPRRAAIDERQDPLRPGARI